MGGVELAWSRSVALHVSSKSSRPSDCRAPRTSRDSHTHSYFPGLHIRGSGERRVRLSDWPHQVLECGVDHNVATLRSLRHLFCAEDFVVTRAGAVVALLSADE